MQKWSNEAELRTRLIKKWENGDFLRTLVMADGCVGETANSLKCVAFPLRLKLVTPSTSEAERDFSAVVEWAEHLRSKSKTVRGYGFDLEEKDRHFRILGRNLIPAYAVFSSLEDVFRFLKVERPAELFRKTFRRMETESCQWPLCKSVDALCEWLMRHPFKLIDEIAPETEKVLFVMRWFLEHPDRDKYLRQLDIEGVDTKFIETHQGTLAQLLECILPDADIDRSQSKFESRFRLKKKPTLVRFRILDPLADSSSGSYPFRDLAVPIEEFARWQCPYEHIFFTENEINFLSFPDTPNAIVLFGKGYGIEALQMVDWLKTKHVYYWGDIDTHGFRILSIARKFLPNIMSFLMDEETLLQHRHLWVQEPTQANGDLSGLTPRERNVYSILQSNTYGTNIRLEQERIRFGCLEQWLEHWRKGNLL